MKKLAFLFLLLPLFASAQNGYDIIETHKIRVFRLDSTVITSDTIVLPFYPPKIVLDTGFYSKKSDGFVTDFTLMCKNQPPQLTVRIYVDDDDKIQALIDALKKAGVIVERTEHNHEKKYSDYLITKKYW